MTSFQQASDFLTQLWARRRSGVPLPTVFLIGPPGIGKTAIARDVHRQMDKDALLEVRDLTSIPPEDLTGLPYRDGGRTLYDPQEWMWKFCQPNVRGVLVLDDLPAAGPGQAAGCRQLALDRKIGTHALSPDVLLVVTGNRKEDKSGSSMLPSHFLNSVITLEIDPEFHEWARWFLNQGGNPLIPAFLSRRSALFSALPTAADKNGCFPTPRTWTMASNILETAKGVGCLPQVLSGLVGEGAATEFVTFLHQAEGLPSPEDTLRDPRGTVPRPKVLRETPDKILALSAAICTLTAREVTRVLAVKGASRRPSQNLKAIKKVRELLSATAWIVGDRADLLANAVTMYHLSGGHPDVLQIALEDCPELSGLRNEIRAALR